MIKKRVIFEVIDWNFDENNLENLFRWLNLIEISPNKPDTDSKINLFKKLFLEFPSC